MKEILLIEISKNPMYQAQFDRIVRAFPDISPVELATNLLCIGIDDYLKRARCKDARC